MTCGDGWLRIWVKKSGQGTAFLIWSSTNLSDGSEANFSAYQMEITYGGQNRSGNGIYRVNWPISHVTLANRQFQIENCTERKQDNEETEIKGPTPYRAEPCTVIKAFLDGKLLIEKSRRE